MKHESEKIDELIITETNLNFEAFYSKPYYPIENNEDIQRANLLLVPNEHIKNNLFPVFPEQTMEFYKFIKEFQDEGILGEICISDEEFTELELHSDLITLAKMVVDSAILPVVIGLITNYVDRKFQGRNEEGKIKVDMTVVDGEKSKSISFEGDANKFEQTIRESREFNIE